MLFSKFCDNCHREPEGFKIQGEVEEGYWFRIPKENLDPAYLMDDLTESFCVGTYFEHPMDDEYVYWCISCLEASGEVERFEGRNQ